MGMKTLFHGVSPRRARFALHCCWLGLVLVLVFWHIHYRAIPQVTPYMLFLLLPPLLLALPGLLRARKYTCQWLSLVAPLYFTHGVMECWLAIQSKVPILIPALLETLLATGLFVSCIALIQSLNYLAATSSPAASSAASSNN